MGRGDLLCPKGAVEGLLGFPILQHLLKVGHVLREGGVLACVHLVGTVEKGQSSASKRILSLQESLHHFLVFGAAN